MSWLPYITNAVALVVAVAAYRLARRALKQGQAETEDVAVPLRRTDWPEIPKTTHRWTIHESDGKWSWSIEELHHDYRWDIAWGCSSTPTVETVAKVVDGGLGWDSRKSVEKAVRRWFWQHHKQQYTPHVDAMASSSGEWSAS